MPRPPLTPALFPYTTLFRSVYRRAHDIPDTLGTAVNVVQMVFGNKGDRSGTGVAFTRNPSTGESETYGDRKSTRLNSSHLGISYAVFCLKKKNKNRTGRTNN